MFIKFFLLDSNQSQVIMTSHDNRSYFQLVMHFFLPLLPSFSQISGRQCMVITAMLQLTINKKNLKSSQSQFLGRRKGKGWNEVVFFWRSSYYSSILRFIIITLRDTIVDELVGWTRQLANTYLLVFLYNLQYNSSRCSLNNVVRCPTNAQCRNGCLPG